jgi:phage terminase large subunit-like protein
VSPDFEAGNVFLPNAQIAPWIGEYIEELVGFPAMPHDDDVDATTQALIRFRDNSGVVTDEMVEHESQPIMSSSLEAW